MTLDIRYIAGLFDGEGYIRIARFKPPKSNHIRYALYGGINMCHRPIIEAVHQRFGGFLGGKDTRAPNRILFGVVWGSQQAARVLREIKPYSIVKLPEIEVALEFQKHIDDRPYKPTGKRGVFREDREQIIIEREEMFQRILALKKYTFPAITLQKPQRQTSVACQQGNTSS